MTTRAQRIATIEESFDSVRSSIPPERALSIAFAALAAAQRDRWQLERQVEQLQAEVRPALKPSVSAATRQYWLDTVLSWAEARLMPPQYDECKRALVGHVDAS